jgi:hypothetical protein
MVAMRASVIVNRTKKFRVDVAGLAATYPHIEKAVVDAEDSLRLGYQLPHLPVDPMMPDVYAIRVDYPPLGSAGLGRFIAAYHGTKPSAVNASQIFTMLRIQERTP